MSKTSRVAVIGAGPAGLMAAEMLTNTGIKVDIYDAMPSVGRKFLMAGKSGLNITHTENQASFLERYGDNPPLKKLVAEFGSPEIITWMKALGIEAHTGSTGRVFPSMMKSSPLLRAWLIRLIQNGASLHTKHKWLGWDNAGALVFETPDDKTVVKPDATIFALGGGSWKRLGSDGLWLKNFTDKQISTSPFSPSNNGFKVDWSDKMRTEFAGAPVKSALIGLGQDFIRGEFVITKNGLESGVIYTLSSKIQNQLNTYGSATITIDLVPDISEEKLLEKLSQPRGKQSLSNLLRKAANLTGVKLALVYEDADKAALQDMKKLTSRIKALPVKIVGTAPLDEAISTSGGLSWSALDADLMIKELDGVFCAGEMIDWDAPTGGYLITACLATGRAAGIGAAKWLGHKT